MKYLNLLKKHSNTIIVLLIVLLICILLYNYFNNPQAINISSKELLNIIKPGKYSGTYDFPSTNFYPNGYTGKINVTFTWKNNSLSFVNNMDCFDKRTKKKLFTVVRSGSFYYKPNHGNNLFKSCKSQINGKIVSNHHGWAVGKKTDSITFMHKGAWHIKDEEYNNINNKITKTNDGFEAFYINNGGLKMIADYKLIN